MKRTSIKTLFHEKPIEQQVLIKGWIRSLRKAKWGVFLVINDGSTQQSIQVVFENNLNNYELLCNQIAGAAVAVQGTVVSSQGKGQSIEIQGSVFELLGSAGEDYPIQKKATSLEFLREVAHFRPRTNTFAAVFRIRHELAIATHQFFHQRGFYYINTPLITAIDAEGAGEMFRVSTLDLNNLPKNQEKSIDFSKDYFGRETFLCVTGQLEAECFAMGMGSVYTFGPTFRSENSHTSRHLAEFWMIEPEVAFADLEEIAQLGADFIKHLIKHAVTFCADELQFLHDLYAKGHREVLEQVMNSEFKIVSYSECIEVLQNASMKFEFEPKWGSDLQTEHERFLTEQYFNGPIIVTDYPKDIKAFYMKQNDDGKTVRAMDILVPQVGEIIGGSQREENFEKILKRMQEMGLSEADYWWYLDLRRHGSAPHSGFGLGFERAIMYITGMSNIRDVIPFARTPQNCDF